MKQHLLRENMRLGMLLCGGFALAFAVATVVIGNNLTGLTVTFSLGNAETMHERIDRGDDRFAFYRVLWRMCMGFASLCCAGLAYAYWRALRKLGKQIKDL